MKKILAVLAFCLFYSNPSSAAGLDSNKAATEFLLSYSVAEAHRIYQNRESYPSTQKFLEQVAIGVKEGLLSEIYQKDQNSEAAYIIYKIDIASEFPRFYRLLEKGKIKPEDSFLSEFSFFLGIRAIEEIKGGDFDTIYNRMRRKYQKEIDEMEQEAKDKAEFISYMKQLKPVNAD